MILNPPKVSLPQDSAHIWFVVVMLLIFFVVDSGLERGPALYV